jgi:gliding motility-associated-like protein
LYPGNDIVSTFEYFFKCALVTNKVLTRKMSIRLLLIVLLLFSVPLSFAQNLVTNPSFESYSGCPSGFQTMAPPPTVISVNDWFTASNGSSDYFNSCTAGATGVPSNFFGWQQPRTGNAYAGGYWVFTQQNNTREYLQTQLSEAMTAGRTYYISFWVSLAETDRSGLNANTLATYQVGAYLSPVMINQNINILNITPHIAHPQGNYIKDTSNWVKVDGFYHANGGERWLILGNYSIWATQDHFYYAQPLTPSTLDVGYYYVDDVCVLDAGSPELVVVHDTAICDQSNSAVLHAPAAMQGYRWSTGDTTQQAEIHQIGTYWVLSMGECKLRVDTFHVTALGAIEHPKLGPDTILCFGQSIQLNAYNPSFYAYYWSNQSVAPSIEVNTTGTYYVKAFSDCGIFSDTIRIKALGEIPAPKGFDTTLCTDHGSSIQLPVTGTRLKWHITPDDEGSVTQPVIRADEAGRFTYFITEHLHHCSSEAATVNVTIINTPMVTLRDTSICAGRELILGSFQEGVYYNWSNGSTNCCIEVEESGVYTVRAHNSCGYAEANATVEVESCELCVWVPTAFSPNYDGINDQWRPQVNCPMSKFTLRIYNRLGQLVYSNNSLSSEWDGTQAGKPCDAGTYFYQIEALPAQKGARPVYRTGDLHLIR